MSEEKQMRPLDDKERTLIQKRLIEHQEERQGLTFARHQAELVLDEGLDASYISQKMKYEHQLNAAKSKLRELAFTMQTCETQLKDGVEVKTEANIIPKTLMIEIPTDMNAYEIEDKLTEMGLTIKKEDE